MDSYLLVTDTRDGHHLEILAKDAARRHEEARQMRQFERVLREGQPASPGPVRSGLASLAAFVGGVAIDLADRLDERRPGDNTRPSPSGPHL